MSTQKTLSGIGVLQWWRNSSEKPDGGYPHRVILKVDFSEPPSWNGPQEVSVHMSHEAGLPEFLRKTLPHFRIATEAHKLTMSRRESLPAFHVAGLQTACSCVCSRVDWWYGISLRRRGADQPLGLAISWDCSCDPVRLVGMAYLRPHLVGRNKTRL